MELEALESRGRFDHEAVYAATDPASGLDAIIAIHDTTLGPALGGTRFHPYPGFEEALGDVLRLSQAMTYKAAVAGVPLGGGKAVIIGDPASVKTDELLLAYGRAVDELAGRYVTAEDVGTTVADMAVVGRVTRYVSGLPVADGGSGDPSPATAHGVLAAMRSVAEHLWGDGRLDGRSVAIQGVGKVGSVLAELVAADGCRVLVADRDPGTADAVAARVGAGVVAAHDIIATRCDILAPCALGGVLDARTIGELDCAAVVGAANNQLAEEADAARLAAARVLYAPDFVVNAGGIINIAEELHPNGYSASRAHERVLRIADSIAAVLSTATSRGITTLAAARVLAEERLRAA